MKINSKFYWIINNTFFSQRKMAKYLLAAVLMGVFCTLCTGSAIPMWEFLSRGEKVSLTPFF